MPVQVYGGLVYMDFEETHMKKHGRGRSVHQMPQALGHLSVDGIVSMQCGPGELAALASQNLILKQRTVHLLSQGAFFM